VFLDFYNAVVCKSGFMILMWLIQVYKAGLATSMLIANH